MAIYNELLYRLRQADHQASLTQLKRGIEKEGLRCDLNGFISQKDHPSKLGSALTHSSITTDYSEALLEFITPVMKSPLEALSYLEISHRFTYQNLSSEVIWPNSMPCQLDGDQSIRIAEYGASHIGQMKHSYRRGLWHRYGRVMQSIAGIHYNFSIPESLWQIIADAEGRTCDRSFRDEKYLGLIRNFRRYSWLLMYLFGASPAACKSFVDGLPNAQHDLEMLGDHTYFAPHATSLRMSDLGYQNNAQASLSVCYNRLDSYIETLQAAVSQPYEAYQSIPVKDDQGHYQQLNDNLLQIENEYYSDIRPKRVAHSGELPLDALAQRGIEYIEIRCTDLNPYMPLGMDTTQLVFFDIFLTWCALQDSAEFSDAECQQVGRNLRAVINQGRQPGLELEQGDRSVGMATWALTLLDSMESLAELMDDAHQHCFHRDAVGQQRLKVADVSQTPSARLLADLQQSGLSFVDFTQRQAVQHRKEFAQPLSASVREHWQRLAEQSWSAQRQLEEDSHGSFDVFLEQYLQRQMTV